MRFLSAPRRCTAINATSFVDRTRPSRVLFKNNGIPVFSLMQNLNTDRNGEVAGKFSMNILKFERRG